MIPKSGLASWVVQTVLLHKRIFYVKIVISPKLNHIKPILSPIPITTFASVFLGGAEKPQKTPLSPLKLFVAGENGDDVEEDS